MEAKDSWEMNETNRTEEAISARYYCYRCHHVGLYNSNSSGLATLGFGSQDVNNEVYEERHEMRALATSSEWILFLANLALEILSAAFDRVSSPRKPRYALIAVGNCGCTCLHLRAPSQWYKGKSCIEE
ncbi:hypothetical protein ACFX2B_007259 [Malus domestica]